jgi:hypothetical protein
LKYIEPRRRKGSKEEREVCLFHLPERLPAGEKDKSFLGALGVLAG